MNQRQIKGKEIIQKENQIKRLNESHYEVKIQIKHDVLGMELGWSCSCPDHQFRKVCCKHIHAVEVSLKLRKTVKENVIIEEVEIDWCQYCKSDKIIKRGIRRNKTHSIQLFQCKECKKRFSVNLGFEKMHTSPQIITSAMQLYFTGESLRGVQKFLKLQGVNMSYVSIYKWIKKYTKLMDNYLNTITPQVGEKWHADEVWLKVKGDRKYLYAMMDDDTRFWIAQEVADSKFNHDAQNLLKVSKDKAKKVPSEFVTDGLPDYNEAFRKEFAAKNYLHKPSKHIKEVHFKNQVSNNNIQERLNGEFRDREKTFRGLKKDDSPTIVGIQLYHNYIRPHMSLNNETPALRAQVLTLRETTNG